MSLQASGSLTSLASTEFKGKILFLALARFLNFMMIFIVRYLAYHKQVIQIISAMRAYELDLARYFWINYLRGVSRLKQYRQVVLRSETDIRAKKVK